MYRSKKSTAEISLSQQEEQNFLVASPAAARLVGVYPAASATPAATGRRLGTEQPACEEPAREQALAAVLPDHGVPSVTTVSRLPCASKVATTRGVVPSVP